jgi:CRP-like cAMP-binding protein
MHSTMSPDAKVEALGGVGQFSLCSPAELHELAAVAEEAVFAPGAVLVRENGRGRPSSYVILSGQADVARSSASITTVGPGSVVGERAGDPRFRDATVTAVTLMHVLVLPESAANGPETNGADPTANGHVPTT